MRHTSARRARATNGALSTGFFCILVKASPATTSAKGAWESKFRFCLLSADLIYFKSPVELSASILGLSMPSLSKLQAKPMLIAVSILSPVSTQSLMPAFLIMWLVSLTPTWSLSSIAVAPKRVNSYSSIALTASSLPSRSVRDVYASIYLSFHWSYSFWVIDFSAISSVLSPVFEYSSKWSSVYATILGLGYCWLSKGFIIESAPLVITMMRPSGDLTTDVILLRAESNSIRFKSSYVNFLPL